MYQLVVHTDWHTNRYRHTLAHIHTDRQTCELASAGRIHAFNSFIHSFSQSQVNPDLKNTWHQCVHYMCAYAYDYVYVSLCLCRCACNCLMLLSLLSCRICFKFRPNVVFSIVSPNCCCCYCGCGCCSLLKLREIYIYFGICLNL